jgi:hypothetical protein
LHLAGKGYEPSLGTGPPASESVSVAGPGIEPGHRPYESQLGASRACRNVGPACRAGPEVSNRRRFEVPPGRRDLHE